MSHQLQRIRSITRLGRRRGPATMRAACMALAVAVSWAAGDVAATIATATPPTTSAESSPEVTPAAATAPVQTPTAADAEQPPGAGAPAVSSRSIQYRGPMPMLDEKYWGSETEIEFELYRSPSGGAPFWSEARPVEVSPEGWVAVDLGQVEPLPDEAFTTPFRFLSILHDGEEFGPRKQVASVVYVAAGSDDNTAAEDYVESYMEAGLERAREAAGAAPDRESRLDELVDCGSVGMETHPRTPANWLEAEAEAARLGARLPTFEEWYGAYDGEPAASLVGLEGHYEWVIPWVYEPQIHARLHELYRGKPVACYYNELSPLNDYPYRLVVAK